MAVRLETHAEPIPGYRLIERLGGGGFGEVWKAEAPGGLLKAIKFVYGDLKGGAEEDGQRAEQELKALSRVKTVRHPYILSLERYDIIDGQLIIVMELADRNLWDRFKECRAQGLPGIPREELLRYCEETAEALDLMNIYYQLQHLDIKPQNLFLVHNHVKVADFGLVKDLEGTQASVTGGVTPVYAAPETFDGVVSRHSDQYSLAIVFQELLTGQRPFSGTNVRQLVVQHLQAAPNLSALPPDDRPIIARAMSKVPDDRFATCREMLEALRGTERLVVDVPATDLAQGRALTPEGERGEATPPGTRTPGPSTDSFDGTTRSLRGPEPVRPTRDSRPGSQAEITGEGVLFPALVIGVGGIGMGVLHRFRESLCEKFGSLDALPHLRTLLIDTDPEVLQTSAPAPGILGSSVSAEAVLTRGEMLLCQLNRPSYYMKTDSRGTAKCALDTWFNARMLYRIPRNQVTAGVRALGRLAFCDHHRVILRRLQVELDTCLDPTAVSGCARHSRLGVRTNRPRVYLVASLAGGTGSGMFLDLAYLIRQVLRENGYTSPDVHAVLFVPTIDKGRLKVLPVGNTYAALSEMLYFSRPGAMFQALYHEKGPLHCDNEPPFNRCYLLPLPREGDDTALAETLELAGLFLSRDLCSPVGKATDLARAGVTNIPWASRGEYFQTFGLFQLAFPRRQVVQQVARVLSFRLVQRWFSKDSAPLEGLVKKWVEEQWHHQELAAEHFITRVQDSCQRVLGKSPEATFAAALDSLVSKHSSELAGARGSSGGFLSRSRSHTPDLDLTDVAEALSRLEHLLGKPEEDTPASTPTSEPSHPGVIPNSLHETAESLAAQWSQKLAELTVLLIEEPEYRLAGAEEAVRQIIALIEKALSRSEPLAKELESDSTEAHTYLRILLGHLSDPRRKIVAGAGPFEVIELLRTFAKKRYQALVLQQVISVFVSLRGHLTDELREVNFCRARIGELARALEAGIDARLLTAKASSWHTSTPGTRHGVTRQIFPNGARSLEHCVWQVLRGLHLEDLLELDRRVQAMLRAQFTALVQICLAPANIVRKVEQGILAVAEAFVNERLPQTDVAQEYLQQATDEGQAVQDLAAFIDEARPELVPNRTSQPTELWVFATPTGEAGDRVRQLAIESQDGVEPIPATSPDDLIIYRELCGLALSELEQLGPFGQEAYRQLASVQDFTPHTRIDIDFGG
jgi:hypothetical protein